MLLALFLVMIAVLCDPDLQVLPNEISDFDGEHNDFEGAVE